MPPLPQTTTTPSPAPPPPIPPGEEAMHAHPSPSETDVLSAEQIITSLNTKRRQLDQEIEAFKAAKEREFGVYEVWLRGRARREIGGDAPPSTGGEGVVDLKEEKGEETAGFDHSVRVDDIVAEEAEERKRPAPEEEGAHEREAEFAGVFTPSFLPLLEGGAGKDGRNGGGQQDSSIFLQEELLASVGRYGSGGENDGSRAPANDSSLPPATESNDLSLNTPPHQPHQESKHSRSISTDKSDNDAASTTSSIFSSSSRRSSFKDPNHTLRSPKRVMFDINNTVVSPSTSPLVERTNTTGTLTKMNSNSNSNKQIVSNGAGKKGREQEEFEIVGKKPLKPHHYQQQQQQDKKHKKHGFYHRSRNQHAAGANAAAGSTITQQSQAEETVTPYFMDDFEKVSLILVPGTAGNSGGVAGGDEDLFTFDEDLDLDLGQERGRQRDVGGEDGEEDEEDERVHGEGEGEGIEARRGGAAMASSPHAGSLPIEIRWPGRRGE